MIVYFKVVRLDPCHDLNGVNGSLATVFVSSYSEKVTD